MGYSRWDNTAFRSYASTTNYQAKTREQLFNRNLSDELNPANIMLRESRDSELNPNSTPIIFGLDVTGSMGLYAERIAKESLPKLMSDILELKPVSDPHMMFMGIDDVHAHSPAALQVSQFEPDIRILEQLQKMWLVGMGGGNRSESYDLPWLFAAKRTELDCLKRGRKGFLFTMGDEMAPYQTVSADQQKRVFGAGEYYAMTPAQSLDAASQKFSVFHLIIEQGSYCSSGELNAVRGSWTELLGNRAIFVRDFSSMNSIVIAAMKIENGVDPEVAIAQDINGKQADLRYAFANLLR